jgi:hypothetical protein
LSPTQKGSSNSRTMFSAALASWILLYDSSLPLSCRAWASEKGTFSAER